jgi:hypothetical protein
MQSTSFPDGHSCPSLYTQQIPLTLQREVVAQHEAELSDRDVWAQTSPVEQSLSAPDGHFSEKINLRQNGGLPAEYPGWQVQL